MRKLWNITISVGAGCLTSVVVFILIFVLLFAGIASLLKWIDNVINSADAPESISVAVTANQETSEKVFNQYFS